MADEAGARISIPNDVEKAYDTPTGSQSSEKSRDFPPETPSEVHSDGVEDWSGPDDPDDPHNWPAWQKSLHGLVPALYAFGLCVGISTFVASVPYIQAEFDISRNMALLPVSLYTVGFIVGPCVASPVSELYGRRWIYLTNYPCLIALNAIAISVGNFPLMVVFRFLAGSLGSGVLAVGAGTLSDIWDMKDGALIGVLYVLAPFAGTTIGPLIGAYVVHQYDDWHWVVWVDLCILAPVGIALLFFKETSKKRILYLRAMKNGTLQGPRDTVFDSVKKVSWGLLKPLHMCFLEPLSVILGLYSAYSFAMIFSFFGSYAMVYSRVYGFNQREIGLCYIPVIVGLLFAIATFGYFNATFYAREVKRTNGHAAPEHLFYAALVGSLLIPIGLFWYAWAPRSGVHWIVPVLAGLPFGWGTLASFMCCMTYVVDVYGINAASAVAANGMLRFALASVFPQFIIELYQSDMGIHWVGTIFAFISVIMIPVPWFIFWKGRELRKRSSYPTNLD